LKYLQKHVKALEASCAAQKKLFLEQQRLPCSYSDEPYNLIEEFGGSASYDNWCCCGLDEPVPINVDDREDVYPLTPDGERFHFICFVEAAYYGHHEHGIILFFEPRSRTALFSFNWT
jgi:hypothetical protein